MNNYKDISLKEVIELAQTDDKNALNELVRRYQNKVYNTFAQLDNSVEISDLTQEVLFRISKSIKNLKNPNHFNQWINRIITNIFYDFLRKKNKITTYSLQIVHSTDEHEVNENTDIEDSSSTPQEESLGNELQEKIENAINGLPAKFRSIVILREIEGLSYDEIANLTKTNIGTIKSRLSRAREKLKDELQEYLE
jgi:RNA polymerase sigma-70 factor (ECF subfamily)